MQKRLCQNKRPECLFISHEKNLWGTIVYPQEYIKHVTETLSSHCELSVHHCCCKFLLQHGNDGRAERIISKFNKQLSKLRFFN